MEFQKELKKNKKIKKFFFCAYIVFLFVLVEISLRLFYPQSVFKYDALEAGPNFYNESSYLPWQLKPSYEGRHMSVIDEFNVSVATNSLGYRDYEFNITKPDGESRILVLGDSFTNGFGVELNEVYHKQLESLLKNNDKKYSVINAGYVSGYSPDTEYLYLKEEGLRLEPDMVIIGVSIGNDFVDYDRVYKHILTFEGGELIKIKSNNTYVDYKGRLRLTKGKDKLFKKILYNFNVFLSFHSHFYVLFKNSFRKPLSKLYFGEVRSNIYSPDYNQETKKNINYTVDFFLKIKELTDKTKIPLVLMLIPDREAVYNEKIKDENGFLLNWTKPSELMDELGSKNNITIIDLLPYFEEYVKNNDEKLYFKIDPHWNKNGHKLAGERVYKELSKKGLIENNFNSTAYQYILFPIYNHQIYQL